ncbi:phage tail protein [Aestuariicoccus sp. MJ-SS9]|uniref:phage tail protein n=1 Tax=Aestuariicoccus sp. MJ-SS9 TaxID=3079855 RepID=UPI00290B9028|nr:phage tail protein [Aestuariicoccus sp. MJ-SS9]MDU8909924.1 phage tail protein [Aestuariicoccus sp. MJ-SS9]
MSTSYPPVAFSFELRLIESRTADAAFQEVSGLQAHLDSEVLANGGEQELQHRLPRAPRPQNVTLKRGVIGAGSDLSDWIRATLESGMNAPIRPRGLILSLLDTRATPVMNWELGTAYPVHVEFSGMPTVGEKDDVAVETLEFAYQTIRRPLTPTNGR